MASTPIAPFLVAPKERMSTPAFHVISAGRAPSAATALAKREPSMCSFRPAARHAAPMAAVSATE